jgi:hypothetical protein
MKLTVQGEHSLIKEKIRAGAERRTRRDCVLFRTPKPSRGQADSMTGRRVGQVFAFFTIRQSLEIHRLAFLSLFETRPMSRVCKLYPLRRTTRFMVIDATDIERGVHLIPKFGNQIGETAKKKREVDNERLIWTLSQVEAGQSTATVRTWLDVMPHYKEFWLNTWIDPHMYRNIY